MIHYGIKWWCFKAFEYFPIYFLELISYCVICNLYLDMAFLIHSLVYLMVIFFACIFVVLANVASSFIHSFLNKSSFGGGGMLIWIWLFNSCIIGCVRQFLVLFVMYIPFLIRWYVLIFFFHIFCSFLGKKSSCCDALLASVGMGVALHVFFVVFNIF